MPLTHLLDHQGLWWQAFRLHLQPCGWALPAEGRSALKAPRAAAQVPSARALGLPPQVILHSRCWPSWVRLRTPPRTCPQDPRMS